MGARITWFAIGLVAALVVQGASAAVLWDEAIDGDLSQQFGTPTAVGPVAPGTYTIAGTIGPDDVVDALSFVIPNGQILTQFVIVAFPPGTVFSSAPFSLRRGPGDFSEVIEFGNFVSLSPPGVDLLTASSAPGPQGAGTYALSVGHPQLGPIPETRSYLVSFTTAVPEPHTTAQILAGLSLLWLSLRLRRGGVRSLSVLIPKC